MAEKCADPRAPVRKLTAATSTDACDAARAAMAHPLLILTGIQGRVAPAARQG